MVTDISRSIKALINAHGKPPREVYLDAENSGPIFREALEEMVKTYLERGYGHPSITHRRGWEAYEKLYDATSRFARFIGSSVDEICYTHSGTEANNLAILGVARGNKNGRKKIVISSIEHLSVVFPAEELTKHGYKVVKVPVDKEGFVAPDTLSQFIDKDTFLVSISTVNHEIGTIQDIKGLVEVVKDKDENIIFHTDAADALGKIPFKPRELGVDLASFSGHKVFGPKGVGALFVRSGVNIQRILYGQLSTQRLWPGLENVPAIVGFSKALEIISRNFDTFRAHMTKLRDLLIDGILESVDNTLLNGPRGKLRAPDNVNISFLFCEGEAITIELSMHGIYVSSGSACTSRVLEPSHVMLAIGRSYEEAHGSILMKVTPMHTEEDVEYVLEVLPRAIGRIRELSPIKG